MVEEEKVMMGIRVIVLLLLLGSCAWQDFRKKTILVWPVILCGGLGFAGNLIHGGSTEIPGMLLGMIPGAALLLAGWVSRGQIGAGDGLTVLTMGIYLGFWETMEIFFYASLSAGVVAFFLMYARKKKKNYEIPFLPFLFFVFVVYKLTISVSGGDGG